MTRLAQMVILVNQAVTNLLISHGNYVGFHVLYKLLRVSCGISVSVVPAIFFLRLLLRKPYNIGKTVFKGTERDLLSFVTALLSKCPNSLKNYLDT